MLIEESEKRKCESCENFELEAGIFYLNEPRQILRGSVLRVLCGPDNSYNYCCTVDDEINC